MFTLLAFAFLAGLATSLSPCVLVVLPIVLSSSLQKSRVQPIATVLGLTISFAFFTLFLGTIVRATGLSPNWLRYLSIFIVFIFGITLLVPAIDRLVSRIFTPVTRLGGAIDAQSRRVRSPLFSGLILGCALGLLWTPCAGPILAAVTSLVATQALNLTAVLLVCAYSIGSALPLLAFAIFGQKLVRVSRFLNRHLESIRRIFGAIMIAASMLMVFDLDTQFVQSALKFVPVISVDTNAQVRAELQKLKPAVKTDTAPEFKGNQAWINSPPLTMASLRGKVVLVDFWTYSCINCLRTIPYLTRWYDTYKDDGFVIVGVHTPEFEFEKDAGNVKRATERFGIRYPVALDNNYATWDAFANEAWPGHYLIDKDGIIRERHFGEGNYQETEEHIRELLNKAPGARPIKEPTFSQKLTPETYLGYARAEAYGFALVRDSANKYAGPELPGPDKVSLRGEFIVGKESILAGDDAALILNFNASQVYLVMSGSSEVPMKVWLDGKPAGDILIKEPRMYDIVDLKNEFGRHVLKLEIPKGISAYAFTFGGG